MKSVSIQEAQADLPQLVEEAAGGASFVIAKAGKPMVKVVPLEVVPADVSRRIGGLEGMFVVPDDFDTFMADEIRALFEDGPLLPGEAVRPERE